MVFRLEAKEQTAEGSVTQGALDPMLRVAPSRVDRFDLLPKIGRENLMADPVLNAARDRVGVSITQLNASRMGLIGDVVPTPARHGSSPGRSLLKGVVEAKLPENSDPKNVRGAEFEDVGIFGVEGVIVIEMIVREEDPCVPPRGKIAVEIDGPSCRSQCNRRHGRIFLVERRRRRELEEEASIAPFPEGALGADFVKSVIECPIPKISIVRRRPAPSNDPGAVGQRNGRHPDDIRFPLLIILEYIIIINEGGLNLPSPRAFSCVCSGRGAFLFSVRWGRQEGNAEYRRDP